MLGVSTIAVIGGRQAGAQAVQSLRQHDDEGRLILIVDEPSAPYQRPPLTKANLKGESAGDRLYIRPIDSYEYDNVETLLSQRAETADIVLVGVGVAPNIELALEAGIGCGDGIVVDKDARTNDPPIFAAGDCTVRPLSCYVRTGRLESVHNAIEQGKLVAAATMAKPRPNIDCPWFWSNQYDLELQIAGLSHGHDEIVVRGEPAVRKFAVFYLKKGRLIAADAVNSPLEFLASKKLIAVGARIASSRLRDLELATQRIAAEAAEAE